MTTTRGGRGERIAAWTRLLDEAADDAMAARCIAVLAQAGGLASAGRRAAATVSTARDLYDMLKAVCRARSGEPDVGVAQLRELAEKSLLAAGELVQLLAEHAGPDARDQRSRDGRSPGGTPRRSGSSTLTCSAATAVSATPPPSLSGRSRTSAAGERPPEAVRLVCRVTSPSSAGSPKRRPPRGRAWRSATTPDLAWRLIMVLVSDGKTPEARQALARYNPAPVSQERSASGCSCTSVFPSRRMTRAS